MAASGSNALDSSEAAMEVPKTLLKLKTENENILMLLGKLKIYTWSTSNKLRILCMHDEKITNNENA